MFQKCILQISWLVEPINLTEEPINLMLSVNTITDYVAIMSFAFFLQ